MALCSQSCRSYVGGRGIGEHACLRGGFAVGCWDASGVGADRSPPNFSEYKLLVVNVGENPIGSGLGIRPTVTLETPVPASSRL